MCGIVAVSLKDITPDQVKLVERVLSESQIRGMHASGVVWQEEGSLKRIAEPVPITKLLEDNPDLVSGAVSDSELNLIAHIRYSTSDLEFNQPIADQKLAIAHNGVISQTDSMGWESEFSLKVSTRNDSELILRALQEGEDPIVKFKDASIAYLSLDDTGEIKYARNGKRPLWITEFPNGFIVTSTDNIMFRASYGEFKARMITATGTGEELQLGEAD
jgi:glutamine phosphoribosylpyrophosphate amidotransferase